MNKTKNIKTNKEQVDKGFIEMADVFIVEANQLCEVKDPDHQLVNAALLYASARFSTFITASLAETKENYQKNIDSAVDFYTKEFNKMLKEHMKQYKVVFDKKPSVKR
ncbi:hypothetical protein [uncultured Gammaproteobacteria bacterium]|jgi:hypothetical protein|uniref:DUF3144 domain-containing protein n=2 Tax=Bathymodiolus azoricus thioautotrophic gill symbiont TaxID=235205 RepID=A0A1H6K3A5_9GAMM|nr:DUF3144 domain-containing protein [Bathymodiolus azoricus thioautotrophic gill symbiont]CAC9490366.1 hypothetical protein [uncultured Gammaproteobacteria bacterium]CAB5507571.1 hypothetical protein AZO1586R_2462 [Bathymodiolus azoricus thioautotrophic gill symbiont]CAC9542271.1 hypothetical protein [uncultured Gammaproteobacteria bacterium]CAC9978123.1 hypothetical protein [uncultured Gammaproteobacteria bacterium]SEH66002.1 conserved hypothetical protein [Bathymodiolus azoricus thioautotro